MPLYEELRQTIVRTDRRGVRIGYRLLRPTDDIVAITDMLHSAYAPLAAAGLHYLASHQTPDVTRQRMSKGDTIVAVLDSEIIGVITLATAQNTGGSPFYDRPGVARFGQFAVTPEWQGSGIGMHLIELVEDLARERGVSVLALDTSEHAARLIELYSAKGYRFVEFVRWSDVNYRSVVMAKEIHRRDLPGRSF